jgi:hypothetical protein
VYLAGNYDDAALLLDKAIAGCQADGVAKIRSLGNPLASSRTEILARHTTDASIGPTAGLVWRFGSVRDEGQAMRHGFRRFDNSRWRVLSTQAMSPSPNDPHHHASEHSAPHSDEKSQKDRNRRNVSEVW